MGTAGSSFKMKHKKRTQKKASTPSVTLSEEEKRLVTDLVHAFHHNDPAQVAARIPDARCARALLRFIPLDHPSTPDLLLRIKDCFEDKQVHKAIKRILFKLKKKGVAIEDPYQENDQAPAFWRPSETEPPRCYVGGPDGRGYRPVMILLNPGTGQRIGLGAVSDAEGVQEFLFGNVSKKRARELKQRFSAESGPLVETSLSHVTSVLEQAYQRSLDSGGEVPSGFLEFRSWLHDQDIPSLDKPVIYEYVKDSALEGAPLTDGDAGTLLDHPLMKDWLIDVESLRPFMEEIVASEESPLILSPEQKTRRVTEIKNNCVLDLFPKEKRRRIRGRLEEMAYLFHQLEEGTKYTGLCLRAAASMDQEITELTTNRFLTGLVDRSMAFYFEQGRKAMESEAETDDPSSSILIS